MKMLKFGGPNLPPGTHTWYERRRPKDSVGGEGLVPANAYPGDLIAADLVVRDTGMLDKNKRPIIEPFAHSFVERGMAEYVEVRVSGKRVYPEAHK